MERQSDCNDDDDDEWQGRLLKVAGGKRWPAHDESSTTYKVVAEPHLPSLVVCPNSECGRSGFVSLSPVPSSPTESV